MAVFRPLKHRRMETQVGLVSVALKYKCRRLSNRQEIFQDPQNYTVCRIGCISRGVGQQIHRRSLYDLAVDVIEYAPSEFVLHGCSNYSLDPSHSKSGAPFQPALEINGREDLRFVASLLDVVGGRQRNGTSKDKREGVLMRSWRACIWSGTFHIQVRLLF